MECISNANLIKVYLHEGIIGNHRSEAWCKVDLDSAAYAISWMADWRTAGRTNERIAHLKRAQAVRVYFTPGVRVSLLCDKTRVQGGLQADCSALCFLIKLVIWKISGAAEPRYILNDLHWTIYWILFPIRVCMEKTTEVDFHMRHYLISWVLVLSNPKVYRLYHTLL